MTRITVVLVIAHLLTIGGKGMAAQEPRYDESALRVESRQGNLRILRGADGTVVASSGIFHGPSIEHLVSSSENALAEAKVFERDYDPGQWLAGIGIATLGAAIGATRIQGVSPLIQVGLYATSFVAMGYGAKKLESAYRALSKAIWWYNRDLTR